MHFRRRQAGNKASVRHRCIAEGTPLQNSKTLNGHNFGQESRIGAYEDFSERGGRDGSEFCPGSILGPRKHQNFKKTSFSASKIHFKFSFDGRIGILFINVVWVFFLYKLIFFIIYVYVYILCICLYIYVYICYMYMFI